MQKEVGKNKEHREEGNGNYFKAKNNKIKLIRIHKNVQERNKEGKLSVVQ